MLNTIVGGTIAGSVAGLIVAAATAAVSRFSRPRFELRRVGETDYAVLINRGWRSVLLGNSIFVNSTLELNLAEDPDDTISRAYLRPNDDLVVLLSNQEPGSTVLFTYLPMWWRPRRKREIELRIEADKIGPVIFGPAWRSRWKEYSVTVTL